MNFVLTPGELTFSDLKLLMLDSTTITLNNHCYDGIHAATKVISTILSEEKTVYGINTGFGLLAETKIKLKDLESLQKKLVLSHATGVGEYLSDDLVRLILALKINSLARGYSGVRLETIEALIKLYNVKIYPCIPEKGSVGASGDLAPLAHLSSVLIGEGYARFQNKIISAKDALVKATLSPLTLAPKEGLALVNGTQVSTALAIDSLFKAESIFISAIVAGSLSIEAVLASDTPFDDRIQQVKGHQSQITVAKWLRELLHQSGIRESHRDCNKVQDPYSLRCQPQVMGAALQQLLMSAETLLIEANAVSDNPIIFSETNDILSGGNFHAEPVAMAADQIAIALAEIGSLSERRIAQLIDTNFTGLPAFLVKNPGLNSGFMIAQVTAAALVSENKSLASSVSVDSIPTSANQEDHVSMATYAARRLQEMCENAAFIVAIELLAACQGIDFRRPLKSSAKLEMIHQKIRDIVPFYEEDRFFAPDINAIKKIICEKLMNEWSGISIS